MRDFKFVARQISSITFLSGAILSGLITATSSEARQCGDLFLSDTSALAIKTEIQSFERKIEFWRNLTGHTARRHVIEANRRFQLMRFHLQGGEVNAVVEVYRQLFRDVELNLHRMRDLRARGESLLRLGRGKEALRLELEARRHERSFGESYGEYVRVRTELETMAAAEGAPAQAAQRALDNLGLRNLRQLFPSLGLPADRVSLDVVREAFRNSPEALLGKLERDLSAERRTAVFMIGLPVLNASQALLYRLPPVARERVTSLLGMSYDVYLRDRYFPEVERLMQYSGGEAQQLRLLMELNAKGTRDELLLVMARLVNAESTWVRLRRQAESERDMPMTQNFLERMRKAEAEAQRLGALSLYQRVAMTERTARMILLITGAGAAAYAQWGDDLDEDVRGLLQALSLLGG
ncbi:MAG TPA: hypothetical protein PLZ57_07760 [Pseudobdellovibrionaceae bacterium]|nr:hypothetical protein [Pseudobdellovibrionaceae bacterium]